MRLTVLTLRDERGAAFAVLGPQGEVGNPLEVSYALATAPPAGKYTVEWSTVASDGHPSHGHFSFTVESAAAVQPPSVDTAPGVAPSSSQSRALRLAAPEETEDAASLSNSLSRAFSFAGILLVIGVVVFNLLVVSRSARIDIELIWRMESRAAVVGVSASLFTILAGFSRMFFEARMMGAIPGMQNLTVTSLLMNTAWGVSMRLQITAALLALIGFLVAIRRIRGAWLLASLAAVILAATPALTGHAAAAARLSGLLIATDFLHVVGASSWLGNLACVMFIGVPILLRRGGEARWQSIGALVNAFSPVALASATIVVLSGVIASWVHLEHLSSLWTTAYGKVLLVKLALVLVTILIGAYNFRRVQPQLVREEGTTRLRRSAAVELTTGAFIIVVTGFLTGISP